MYMYMLCHLLKVANNVCVWYYFGVRVSSFCEFYDSQLQAQIRGRKVAGICCSSHPLLTDHLEWLFLCVIMTFVERAKEADECLCYMFSRARWNSRNKVFNVSFLNAMQ